jgi:hypothetical protein
MSVLEFIPLNVVESIAVFENKIEICSFFSMSRP